MVLHRSLDARTGRFDLNGSPMTPWITYPFAQKWFIDATKEAESVGRDARRREIVFAVAAAESYIFEWTSDVVLKHSYEELPRYFPAGWPYQHIRKKWEDVPKRLAREGRIQGVLDYATSSAWADFDELVNYRNGLIHASVSRPSTPGQPDKEGPFPKIGVLDEMVPGTPVNTIVNLILELNTAAGTSPPDWAQKITP